jgi:hypothetical protein
MPLNMEYMKKRNLVGATGCSIAAAALPAWCMLPTCSSVGQRAACVRAAVTATAPSCDQVLAAPSALAYSASQPFHPQLVATAGPLPAPNGKTGGHCAHHSGLLLPQQRIQQQRQQSTAGRAGRCSGRPTRVSVSIS